jgi:hypothetical protein
LVAQIAHALPAALYPFETRYGRIDGASRAALRRIGSHYRSSPFQGNSSKTHMSPPLVGMLMGLTAVFSVIMTMGPVLPAVGMTVRFEPGLVVMGMLV